MTTPRRRSAPGWAGAVVLAVGHSTRPVEELVALLHQQGVRTVADIRTIPRSRHNPQFEAAALARALAAANIRYAHLPRLGGLRRPRPESPNTAWRNASFRGYADHMLTPEFAEGLDELKALAQEGPVALMCAEAVPWRCHRSLVADALWARGVVVGHLTGPGSARPHRVTPFAHVSGRRVTYPGALERPRHAEGRGGGGASRCRGRAARSRA